MTTKKKYKIVIDRSKWVTGVSGVGDYYLLNDNGFKCCLGFITQQITKKGISGCFQPEDCEFSVPFLNLRDGDFYVNTELSIQAIYINDKEESTLKEKEAALKLLFKNTPISLTFKGKAVPYNE